jgi:hypothetical protein
LGCSLNRLRPSSRSPRVIRRNLDPLTSRDPLRILSGHHFPHPPAKFGAHHPVNERLLDYSRKLALPTNLCRTSVAADSLNMNRLDSVSSFTRPWRHPILANLKSRPFLDRSFPIARSRCTPHSLQPLRGSSDPSSVTVSHPRSAATLPFIALGGLDWGWWHFIILATFRVATVCARLVELGGTARLAMAGAVFIVVDDLVEFWWPRVAVCLLAWACLASGVCAPADRSAPALWPALKGRRPKKQDVISLALEPQMASMEEEHGKPDRWIRIPGLLTIGLAVTPHRLSKVVADLRGQSADSAGLPKARRALKANAGAGVSSGVGTDSSAGLPPVTRVSCVPRSALSPSTATIASPPSRYGIYDPRLLDEIMRSTPDMKALAKLAPK